MSNQLATESMTETMSSEEYVKQLELGKKLYQRWWGYMMPDRKTFDCFEELIEKMYGKGMSFDEMMESGESEEYGWTIKGIMAKICVRHMAGVLFMALKRLKERVRRSG